MITELKNNTACAKISTAGAELKSLIIDGREIMWCSNPAYWGKSSPFLFPAVGNVRSNKTVINGKTRSLSKHGFARDNEFSADKISDSCAIFSYTYAPTSEDAFPYSAEVKLTYTLYSDKLEIKYSVTNLSDGNMPFCIGAHPAIACDNLNNCTLHFEKKETASTPVMNLENRMFESKNRIDRLSDSDELALNYTMFDNDVVYFDNLKSRSVTLTENGKTLACISFDGFETLGLWTPAGKNAGFICIEPWCGSDDYDDDDGIFEHKKGIQFTDGKNSREYVMTISAK